MFVTTASLDRAATWSKSEKSRRILVRQKEGKTKERRGRKKENREEKRGRRGIRFGLFRADPRSHSSLTGDQGNIIVQPP
ncbi:unnamed protein product [Lactuca virosa]|uniref:Uncharacterized protein n=1 Tax=Lactuca virosa TaxID=75947 RepID=A0AAU9NR66_9ASTR|nr:unnamed protein product [Lactuca virosa]